MLHRTRWPTAFGLIAILLWAALALLTTGTEGIPPFQLTAMTFLIAGLSGITVLAIRGEMHLLRQPWQAWLLGLYGLFGYHALYFTALKLAPPAAANLVNYTWPLLIVLFSAFLPSERLTTRQVLGGMLGMVGVVVLALGGPDLAVDAQATLGLVLAGACALIWSSYSVLSRLMARAPSQALAGACLAAGVLAALLHVNLETTVYPAGALQWLTILVLAVGPVGAAFFLWDIGMKQGDIRLLGVAAFSTPVLSTLLLVLFGRSEASVSLWLACLLIVAGAVVAARKPEPPRAVVTD